MGQINGLTICSSCCMFRGNLHTKISSNSVTPGFDWAILWSLNKTTKYYDQDVLDNCCSSAHYLAHTEFGVEGGCSLSSRYNRFMSCCQRNYERWCPVLALAQTKSEHKSLPRLRSFASFDYEKFGKNSLWTKAEVRRRDMDSCLTVLSRPK